MLILPHARSASPHAPNLISVEGLLSKLDQLERTLTSGDEKTNVVA